MDTIGMNVKNLVSILLVLAVATWSMGCSQRTIREYRVGENGASTVKNVTEEQYWKEQVDERIADEAARKKPDGYESWREYYQWWFGVLRKKRKMPFKSAEFKNPEDLVNYIKEKRRAKGLPSYED